MFTIKYFGLVLLIGVAFSQPDICNCPVGFYLKKDQTDSNNDKCEKIPQINIDNCLILSYDGQEPSCKKCVHGFYKKSEKSCAQNPQQGNANFDINCAEYNSQGKCQFCNNGKYLASDQTCKDPTKIITNCFQYENATTCAKCEFSYQVDKSTGECVTSSPQSQDQKVENCILYEIFNNVYTCSICQTRFMIQDSLCIELKGNNFVEGCSIYSQPGKCQQCDDYHYLNGTICNGCPISTNTNSQTLLRFYLQFTLIVSLLFLI